MNKNAKPVLMKGKGAALGIVVCFVAVVVMVGVYTLNNYQQKLEEQLASAEEQAQQARQNSWATTTDEIVLPQTSRVTENEISTEDDLAETDGNVASSLWFDEESLLDWPASGATLISYSMDKTVYFATLEQYKYNPAMIIGGEVGEIITASAAGIVIDIEESATTGTTVTLDMGNGYHAIYGQLENLTVGIGDYLDQGDLMGYLAEPTKYYSVEGPNLFFEITQDGTPVNPVDFMEH
jgi:septal ring factor EnvC (AmiA/AmiB activator)